MSQTADDCYQGLTSTSGVVQLMEDKQPTPGTDEVQLIIVELFIEATGDDTAAEVGKTAITDGAIDADDAVVPIEQQHCPATGSESEGRTTVTMDGTMDTSGDMLGIDTKCLLAAETKTNWNH